MNTTNHGTSYRFFWKRLLSTLLSTLTITGCSLAATIYTVPLDEASVVPSTGAAASGIATLTLSDSGSGPRLAYTLNLLGVDLDGLQTPGIATDNVTAVHFHRGEAGTNGPHVLNAFGIPRVDDADMTFDPVAGTISGIWDDSDENLAGFPTIALSDAIGDLLAGNLYIQVHTVDFPSGAIRGQIVPEPSAAAFFAASVLTLSLRRRRSAAPSR